MSTIVLDSLNYVGEGIVNGVSRFVERSAGLPAYFRMLTSSVTLTTKADRANIKWKLVLPFPATQPEDCPCVGQAPYIDTIVNIDVRLDGRAPKAYRDDIVDAIQSLVATAQFTGSVEDLINPA